MTGKRLLIPVSLAILGIIPANSPMAYAGTRKIVYCYCCDPNSAQARSANAAGFGTVLLPLLTGIGFNLLQSQFGLQTPFRQSNELTPLRATIDDPEIARLQSTIERIEANLPKPPAPMEVPTPSNAPVQPTGVPSFFPVIP